MVLGIIAITYAFITMLAMSSTSYKIDAHFYHNDIAAYAFGTVLIQSVLAIVGLPLSIVGNTKFKNGKNITGIILNTITLAASIIMFIYVVTTY